MILQRIDITHLRNYSFQSIQLNPKFTLISGPNGSGKTSFLEAIHLLSLGRSFRSHLTSRIIQDNANSCCIFGEVENESGQKTALGIEKSLDGKTHVRVNGENLQSVAELAKLLPLQLINQDTFQLLTAGPKCRRQFLDWGLFHVEPLFFTTWRNFTRALQQRNAALRAGASNSEIHIWDSEFISNAILLTQQRQAYVEQIVPIIEDFLQKLLMLESFSITYYLGWDQKRELANVLTDGLSRDRQLTHTQHGPHRADLRLKIAGVPAEDVLSRGQQKLLVCALSLAQGKLLQQATGKHCLYLVDDLASELDTENLTKIMLALENLSTQVIITGVNTAILEQILLNQEVTKFHLEQGKLTEVQIKAVN